MNDFTKEELEAILYDLTRNKNPWQCGESILNKLQYMINDYCEHDNLREKHNDEYVAVCRNCGVTFSASGK